MLSEKQEEEKMPNQKITMADVSAVTEDQVTLKDGRALKPENDYGRSLLKACQMTYADSAKQTILDRFLRSIQLEKQLNEQDPATQPQREAEKKVELAQHFINFFREFEFAPGYRFMNTLAYLANADIESAREYAHRYFEVSGNTYADSVGEKVKSPEFTNMLNDLSAYVPSKQINTRLTILYGPQGGGKTTLADKLCEGRFIPCHSGMLPQDLMEDFDFVDGKSTFKPSAFQRAMVEGKRICLDEGNLLPFETLRFLQTVLDGKREIIWKGNLIEIKDGFEAVITMNLNVGAQTFGLPDPLVDRASVITKMDLKAESLADAF